MVMVYTDFMVDIETTGIRPDRHAVIQVAAVRFDLRGNQITSPVFCKGLHIPRWRSWDEGTRNWWQNKLELLHRIMVTSEPTYFVMNELRLFVENQTDQGTTPRFWAHNAHFDYSFLDSYFNDYAVINPWEYRSVMNIQTYLAGAFPFMYDIPKMPGNTHSADEDILNQVRYLCDMTALAMEANVMNFIKVMNQETKRSN